MLKRAVYIIIAISILLLIPSTYGVVYCFVSEKMIGLVEPIEEEIAKSIAILENKKLICQIDLNYKNKEGMLTPEEIIELDNGILDKCRDYSSKCFNAKTSGYIHGTLKISNGYTENIEVLRYSILSLRQHIREIRNNSRDLFCYIHHSYFEIINFDDEEIKRIVLANGDDSSCYTKLLHVRMKEVYGIDLDQEKARAQENLDNHIARLKEYLNTIRAARLAHEPHRPMIRFIGWSWLIFESIGMVLLLCVVSLEVNAWKKKKDERER